jgi:hypothetical protein
MVSGISRLEDGGFTMPELAAFPLALKGNPAQACFCSSPSQNHDFLRQLERQQKKQEFIEHVDRILGVGRKYLTLEYLDRRSGFAQFAEAVNIIKAKGVAGMSEQEVDLLCAVGLFGMARVRLEQINLVVNMNRAIAYLHTTMQIYNERLSLKKEEGLQISPDDPWWTVAPQLPALRSRVDKWFYRLAQIDGSDWNRAELLLDRATIDTGRWPQKLQDVLKAELPDYPFLLESRISEHLREVTRKLIKTEGSPLRVLKAVMRAACEDPVTYSDYSTLLFPRGTKLEEPWTTTPDDFAAFVVFRADFEPPEGKGIGDFTMIQKAMLAHHAAKKARNASVYLKKYGPGANPSISDDLGELGVYFNESAHHKGHIICGVNSAMRFLMGIEVSRPNGRLRVEGLTDFRITRVSNAIGDRFKTEQFPLFYNYGCWVREIVEASFEDNFIFPRNLIG